MTASDSASPLHHHGGNLAAAAAAWNRPRAEWLDLSTGINPVPYPIPPLPQDAFHRLPEPDDMAAVERAARMGYGIAQAASVVAAPGTQALIQALPLLKPAGRVRILAPTYGEHAAAWARAGHAVEEVRRLPDPAEADGGVVLLCNPNNPDGATRAPGALLALAAAQAERGGWLVVDEAFADVMPALSLSGEAGVPGLVVLRSPGKFYGLAGLRLGFALCAPDLAARLTAHLGPWAVSGPALAVGSAALADAAWRDRTRRWLAERRAALDAVLAEAGLHVCGGTDLFRLIETPDAAFLFERLAAAGILVRPFSYAPHWLRLGIPGADDDLARLRAVL